MTTVRQRICTFPWRQCVVLAVLVLSHTWFTLLVAFRVLKWMWITKLLWFEVSSPGFIVLKLTFLFISALMETLEGFRPQNISEASLKIRGKKRKWIWKQQEAKLIWKDVFLNRWCGRARAEVRYRVHNFNTAATVKSSATKRFK